MVDDWTLFLTGMRGSTYGSTACVSHSDEGLLGSDDEERSENINNIIHNLAIRTNLVDQHSQHPRTKSSPGSRLATERYAAVLDELGQLSDFSLFDRKVPL